MAPKHRERDYEESSEKKYRSFTDALSPFRLRAGGGKSCV